MTSKGAPDEEDALLELEEEVLEEFDEDELLEELLEELELDDEASPPVLPPHAPKKLKQSITALAESLFIRTPKMRSQNERVYIGEDKSIYLGLYTLIREFVL